MNTIASILFRTNDTFDYLDTKYADEVNPNCNLIFMLTGVVGGLASFNKDMEGYKELFGDKFLIVLVLFNILLGAGIGFLYGTYIVTYILFGIGKILKAKGKLIDIKVVVAYSFIPIILSAPVIFCRKIIGIGSDDGIIILLSNVYYVLIWLWSMKIMIQGLKRYNKYGLIKAFLNASPFLFPGLTYYVYSLIKYF